MMKQRKIKAHRSSIQKMQHLSTRHSIRKIQRIKRKNEKVTKKERQTAFSDGKVTSCQEDRVTKGSHLVVWGKILKV